MTEVRELDSAPRMRTLYPKAGLGAARGLLGKLPVIGGDGSEPRLPDRELRLRGVEVDRDHLADYDRVCEFRLRDVLPPTYPHILAFPLSMELMTSGDFPFPVIGMVHVRNRIEQVRPIDAGEPIDIRVWTEDLRPHEKGLQFEMRAEVTTGAQVVWRSWSTYLRRTGGDGSSGSKDRAEPPRPQAQWKLPGDTGRSYAGVSGDSNPIHMHPLSARLFGMPRPIAHGMYMKARCLAALEGHLPDAASIDVSFKLPVFIPGTVSFASWEDGGASGSGRAFALHDKNNEKPHLTGTAKPRS